MKEWLKLNELIVGFIEDRTYYTFRKPEHFMRKFGGFGLSIKIIEELIKKGIKDITFIYDGKREKSRFSTTIMDILELGLIEHDYTFGFPDKQYFIPIKDMKKMLIKKEDWDSWFK